MHLSAATEFSLDGAALADALAREGIRRDADGSYWLALYEACVHLGARIRFYDACFSFKCPSHGAHFNSDGEYLDGPAPRNLDRFPISFVGENVVVDTGRLILGADHPSRESRLMAVPAVPCTAQPG